MACVSAADAAVLPAGYIVVLLAGVLVRLLVLEQQPDGQRATVAIIAAHTLCTDRRCTLVSKLLSGFDDKVTDMSPSLVHFKSLQDISASPDILAHPARSVQLIGKTDLQGRAQGTI